MAKNIDLQYICHIQSLGVTKTATFIVDLDVLFSDLKADDLSTWNANRTKSTCLSMSPSGGAYCFWKALSQHEIILLYSHLVPLHSRNVQAVSTNCH